MAERSSDLRADVAVLRRRWRIIAAAVVLGVALGVLYAHLVPAQLTSRSLVLLSNGGSSGGGSGDTGVDTQVQIVLSTPVLAQAGRAVHPALSATEVLKRVDVQPATSQLLRIDASSPQAKDAQALSQAVAEAYVQRATDNVRSVTGAIVADLRTRRDALDHQVKALQTQIDATSARLSGEDASPRWASGTPSCWPSCRPSRRTSRSSWTASRVSWPPAAPSAPPPPWPRSSSRPLRPRALTRCSDR